MTAHRHKNSAGKWVTVTDGTHTHEDLATDARVDAVKAALGAQITALEVRVAALESGEEPGPEPEPPGSIALTNITVTEITKDSARISWNSNPPATGQVEYGETTSYGKVSSPEANLLPYHSQKISGLQPSKTYHFRVKATTPATP